MLFRVTVFLMLCVEFISGRIAEAYQSRNAHALITFGNEKSPDFNDLIFSSGDEYQSYEDTQPSNENYKKYTYREKRIPTANNEILEEPKLMIDNNEISDPTVYSKVDEMLKVVCKANSGTIQWRGPENPFLNKPILSEPIAKNKLALKFKSIALEQGGNYTCKVLYKNTAKKTKSFVLKVIEPVQIIEFPQNLTSPEGSDLTLRCMTSGYPNATVDWSFNETLSNGSTRSIRIVDHTNSRYKLDDDNLLISNITLQEAGNYTCVAKQSIQKGSTDNKTVHVVVHHKPFPTQKFTAFKRALNSVAEIPCGIISNPVANYTWFRKMDGIYRNISLPSIDPALKITLTNSSQYGEYKCQANNSLGYSEQYILLNPKKFLQPPKVEFIKVTESVVSFKAVPESDSNATHYKVQYRKKNDEHWTNKTITLKTISATEHKLANLTEKTNYILRVRSVNELGTSAPSNEIEFTTKELPTPPNIKIKKLTDSLVYFNIIAENNSTLTRYNVEFKIKDAKNWLKSYFIIPKGATENSKYYLSGLSENTTYIMRLRSVNEFGTSAPSKEIEFTTKELPRPPKIEIKELTSNVVYFKATAESNRTLIRFNAEYKTKDAKNWKTSYFTIPKRATWKIKYCLQNLNKNTTYILRVRSVNELGISAPSNEIELTTLR